MSDNTGTQAPMKTSERKMAKQHIAHLRRREDYLRAKVKATGMPLNGWELGELSALAWAMEQLKPLTRRERPNAQAKPGPTQLDLGTSAQC